MSGQAKLFITPETEVLIDSHSDRRALKNQGTLQLAKKLASRIILTSPALSALSGSCDNILENSREAALIVSS